MHDIATYTGLIHEQLYVADCMKQIITIVTADHEPVS